MKFPKPGDKKKKGKTKEETDHLKWIASLPCSIPGCPDRSCVHHIRESGEPRDHFKTIPLCWNHHQGKEGLHHLGKKLWSEIYGSESYFLKIVQKINP